MLYKKTHRQYLREFRKGREFKFNDGNEEVYKIFDEPIIDEYNELIWVDCMNLISLYSGQLLHKNYIIWLN